ncbi:uncharacterized protein LOC131319776 [Rhododendron vialii]|uniref:uncharacterized protein LOC131319776 n=1 Tax=Rhododendron vialii TaxID=182163 RepID=UPI00265E9192|nr:uncharacterized protein LOC131319776 [Rhododendron vialii]
MLIKNFAGAGRKRLLLPFLLVLFPVTCHGNENQEFINSCGDVHNITFPFQLKGDPSNNTCNDYLYTLSCDKNNRTVLRLLSGKYYVQSIDYTDHSIRLVDVGIQTNNICSSFPLSSFNGSDFYPLSFSYYSSWSSVLFLSCEKPVQSPTYINRTRYCNSTRDESGNGYYSYVMAGRYVRVWDFADSCLLEVSYISTSRLIRKRGSNLSWLDLNKELGYGFDITWDYDVGGCERCRKRASCFRDSVNVSAVCDYSCGTLWSQIVCKYLSTVHFEFCGTAGLVDRIHWR